MKNLRTNGEMYGFYWNNPDVQHLDWKMFLVFSVSAQTSTTFSLHSRLLPILFSNLNDLLVYSHVLFFYILTSEKGKIRIKCLVLTLCTGPCCFIYWSGAEFKTLVKVLLWSISIIFTLLCYSFSYFSASFSSNYREPDIRTKLQRICFVWRFSPRRRTQPPRCTTV